MAATMPILIRSLKKDRRRAGLSPPLPSLRGAFSLYDQINLIDNVPEDQLRFQGYTETGFTVNRVDYEGSLLCVGNLLMSWSPKNFSEITPESLSIFQILRPIPEILILGCGRYIEPVNPALRKFIRSIGMKLEAVDTRNAASTYNILNEEGRIVAAALLPDGVSEADKKALMDASQLSFSSPQNLICIYFYDQNLQRILVIYIHEQKVYTHYLFPDYVILDNESWLFIMHSFCSS